MVYYFCNRWRYQSQAGLDGSKHSGVISNYDGGGYAQKLGANLQESAAIIAELKNNSWLDRATRALFVDLTLYNANINAFCVVRYSVLPVVHVVCYRTEIQFRYIKNS